jgi:glyoxylase-like metal-dependent hydrolase (beta-lactamase superfamily II)
LSSASLFFTFSCHLTSLLSSSSHLQTFNLGEEFSPDGSQFDKLWADGEEWTLGELSCYVLHTPGHTPACMTYVIGDAAFSGDTVFMPDFGSARCDFPGGDAETLFTSVTDKLYGLPDGTRLFVGHDYKPGGRDLKWETTVAEEKSTNKHMNMSTEKGEFIAWREGRDTTLNAPKLLLPSLQVNLRNGSMPPAEANGVSYLKMPVSYCCGAVDEAH